MQGKHLKGAKPKESENVKMTPIFRTQQAIQIDLYELLTAGLLCQPRDILESIHLGLARESKLRHLALVEVLADSVVRTVGNMGSERVLRDS